MNKVAIAGYATQGFSGDTGKQAMDEMVMNTSMAALDNANVTHEEVDSVVYTGQDTYDGAAISDGQKVSPAGGYRKPFMRIQNGGGAAIHQAAAKIQSGKADVVSVVAADFVTADDRKLSWSSHEALYHRPFGQNKDQSYGFLTTNHLERGDITVEDLARVAAKNYEAAAANETAHRQQAYSVEEILESDRIVGELTELMVGPLSFGAAVCVLMSESVAKEKHEQPVWISGTGMNTDRYWYRDMDRRLDQPTLGHAAETAMKEADVTIDDVDAVEVASHSPTLELLSYETLGMCEAGEAASLVRDGVTSRDGELPVNLSGGPIPTNPPNSGGIYRVIAGAQILNGELGDHSADTTLVADNDMHLGEPGRTDAVLVLKGGAA